MDLGTQLGIVSGTMGVIILLFTAYFLWMPKDSIAMFVKVAQNKERIKWVKVVLLVLAVVWVIIAFRLIQGYFF